MEFRTVMLATYFPVLVLMLLAAGFIVHMLVLTVILGPKNDSAVKDDPFECGTIGTGSARDRFSVKFYLVAMIFILFDVEIVFLYPWAVRAVELGWYGFAAMLSFVAVLGLGLAYIWKRGLLDWN